MEKNTIELQKWPEHTWNAKRLIQEYLKMANLINYYQGKPFDEMAWSNQIRVKRIASALCAFIGLKEMKEEPVELIKSVFDRWQFASLLEGSPLQEEDRAKAMALVKEAMNDERKYDSLIRNDFRREDPSCAERRKNRERSFMLLVLMEYREKAQQLISHFDGLMEGTVGAYLAVLAVKRSCIEPLQRNNEMIDDIIVLLLGNRFKQSFSEDDLKANYGYPKETDDQLFEWDCDNM